MIRVIVLITIIMFNSCAASLSNDLIANIPKLQESQLSEYSGTLKKEIKEIAGILSSGDCNKFIKELEKRYPFESVYQGSGILLVLYFNKKQSEEGDVLNKCHLDILTVLEASLLSYRLINNKDGDFNLWPRFIVNEMVEENFYNILGKNWNVKLAKTNLSPFPIENGYKALLCSSQKKELSNGLLKNILDNGKKVDYSQLQNILNEAYLGCSRVAESFPNDRSACLWLEVAKHNATDETFSFAPPGVQYTNLSVLFMSVPKFAFYFEQEEFKVLEAKKREILVTSDQVTEYVKNTYDRKLEYFTNLILKECSKHFSEEEYSLIKKQAHNLPLNSIDELIAGIESN